MKHNSTTTMARTRSIVISVLALVVLATACGDDGGSAAGGRSFCEIAQEQDARSGDLDMLSATPEQLESDLNALLELTDAGIAAAPNDSIRADLQTLRDGQAAIVGVLADADYRIGSVDPAAFEASADEAAMDAAEERVEAYTSSECGVDNSDDDDDDADVDPADLPDDVIGDLLDNPAIRQPIIDGMTEDGQIDEGQANCLLDQLGLDFMTGFAGDFDPTDPSSAGPIVDALGACGIPLDAFG
ncbi:MAG: hypothetical protein AAF548_10130 [Actinomycetota bacterium]